MVVETKQSYKEAYEGKGFEVVDKGDRLIIYRVSREGDRHPFRKKIKTVYVDTTTQEITKKIDNNVYNEPTTKTTTSNNGISLNKSTKYNIITPQGQVIATNDYYWAREQAKKVGGAIINTKTNTEQVNKLLKQYSQSLAKSDAELRTAQANLSNMNANILYKKSGESEEFKEVVKQINDLGAKPVVNNPKNPQIIQKNLNKVQQTYINKLNLETKYYAEDNLTKQSRSLTQQEKEQLDPKFSLKPSNKEETQNYSAITYYKQEPLKEKPTKIGEVKFNEIELIKQKEPKKTFNQNLSIGVGAFFKSYMSIPVGYGKIAKSSFKTAGITEESVLKFTPFQNKDFVNVLNQNQVFSSVSSSFKGVNTLITPTTKIYKDPDVISATVFTGFIALGGVGGSIGTEFIQPVLKGAYTGSIAVGTYKTIKNPSPENIGSYTALVTPALIYGGIKGVKKYNYNQNLKNLNVKTEPYSYELKSGSYEVPNTFNSKGKTYILKEYIDANLKKGQIQMQLFKKDFNPYIALETASAYKPTGGLNMFEKAILDPTQAKLNLNYGFKNPVPAQQGYYLRNKPLKIPSQPNQIDLFQSKLILKNNNPVVFEYSTPKLKSNQIQIIDLNKRGQVSLLNPLLTKSVNTMTEVLTFKTPQTNLNTYTSPSNNIILVNPYISKTINNKENTNKNIPLNFNVTKNGIVNIQQNIIKEESKLNPPYTFNNVISVNKLGTTNILRLEEENLTKSKNKVYAFYNTFNVSQNKLIQDTKTDLKQEIQQKQVLISQQITKEITKPPIYDYKFKYNPDIIIEQEQQPPKSTFFNSQNFNNQNNNKGFDVFVKRRGLLQKVNPQPLSKESALNYGQFFVGNTSAASFKIKQSLFNAVSNFVPKGNPLNFYKSKSGFFVEKKEKRIKSRGELFEITYKGLFKQRMFGRKK